MKICGTCKINKQLIEFSKRTLSKDGLQNNCIECVKQHYIDNIEYHKQNNHQNYMKNSDKAIEKAKQYYIDNKIKITQYNKEYRQLNKTELLNKQKQYYQKNADRIIEKVTQYNRINSIVIKQNAKQYAQTPQGKLANKVKCNKRRSSLISNTPSGKHFTPTDIILKLKLQHNKCVYCKTSIKEYYEIDHIIPLIKYGNNEPSNIQLLCKKCNGSGGKGTKDAIDFAKKHNMLF